MKEATAFNILKAARAKIAHPEDWSQGERGARDNFNTYCAAEAIEECGLYNDPISSRSERLRAFRALTNAAAVDHSFAIVDWNDAPERKHSEVLAVFDLAIATLRLR